MKKIVFTEEFCTPELLFPFTLTRQIQDIRTGIFTIREKWEAWLGLESYDRNENDYKDKNRSIALDSSIGNDIIYLIHGNILPTPQLVKQVKKLRNGQFISVPEKESIIYCISGEDIQDSNKIRVKKAVEYEDEIYELKYAWDIFTLNKWAIEQDFEWIAANRKKSRPHASNELINSKLIFIEKGASVQHCILNATDGPIYIGRNAMVMEGSLLRGPLAICENATVKMGTRIYGATTIGPSCVVGGEIKNSVLFDHSNKAHDGYLGDSVIGSWCNLGAGTTNSNLKNNASEVQVWTPTGSMKVGLKCGVLMGDYSKTAINTSINTGTVIGTCCNVFGAGLTPKYIPSFSWGSEGIKRYELEKALDDINNWKMLKKESITENEKNILKHIFDYY